MPLAQQMKCLRRNEDAHSAEAGIIKIEIAHLVTFQ